MSAMIARVPGHDRGGQMPKRHHGDEERVMFLPSVDANLTVCQFGLTRGERPGAHADVDATIGLVFDDRSFMLVSASRIDRLLILDLRWRVRRPSVCTPAFIQGLAIRRSRINRRSP
jgi:hypothetical protein